jgi:formylglycine-generating enzyme required for sulfatase activity
VGNYAASVNVDDFANTSPVGSFTANAFGLSDMGGTVWQWCEDLYTPTSTARVLRGGSWGYSPQGLRSVNRVGSTTAVRDYGGGFRVARTP